MPLKAQVYTEQIFTKRNKTKRSGAKTNESSHLHLAGACAEEPRLSLAFVSFRSASFYCESALRSSRYRRYAIGFLLSSLCFRMRTALRALWWFFLLSSSGGILKLCQHKIHSNWMEFSNNYSTTNR